LSPGMRVCWHGGRVNPDGDDQDWSRPLLELPMPSPVAAALESLLAPRGRPTRGPGERGRVGHFEPVSEDEAREWLGFAPPTLPSLSAAGFSRHFARQGSRELVSRAELGRGESMAVYVFYLPPGVEWTPETTFAEARRQGLTLLWLRAGYGVPWPGGARESSGIRRDPASGDSMTVLVGSTTVGVQHQRGVTRLAWSYRSAGAGEGAADFNVTVMSARPPRAAVEMLVADHVAVGLG
jgi:hypothetical protein